MKKVGILGLSLVVVLAFSAIAVASASAEFPSYLACVKKKGGNYEKGCGKKVLAGSGKAELESVVKGTKFTSKSKAATFKIGTHTVTCKKDTDEGEYTFGQYDKEKITFSKCIIDANKKDPCQSAGAASGTITTEELLSAVEYTDPAETTVGVLLGGEHLGEFAKFTCGSEAFSLVGGVLSSVENTKKGQKLTFSGATKYFEEGEEDEISLNAGPQSVTFTTVDEQSTKSLVVGVYPFTL